MWDTVARREAKSLPSGMDEMQNNVNIADMGGRGAAGEKQEKEKGVVSHGGEGTCFK